MFLFQDFFSDPRFLVTNGNEALVDGVSELMTRTHSPHAADDCREAAKRFVTTFDEAYSMRLLKFVEEVVAKPKTRGEQAMYNGQPA